jgi:hypothetical protein
VIDMSKVKETIEGLDRVVTAVKATGGYKYRAEVRMPDEELERFVAGAETELRGLALRILAAEHVIWKYGHEADYELTRADISRMLAEAKATELPRIRPRQAPNRAMRRREARRGAA